MFIDINETLIRLNHTMSSPSSYEEFKELHNNCDHPSRFLRFRVRCNVCGFENETNSPNLNGNLRKKRGLCKRCNKKKRRENGYQKFNKNKFFEMIRLVEEEYGATIIGSKQEAYQKYIDYRGKAPNANVEFRFQCNHCSENFETTISKITQIRSRNKKIKIAHGACASEKSYEISKQRRLSEKEIDKRLAKKGLIKLTPYDEILNQDHPVECFYEEYPLWKTIVTIRNISHKSYRAFETSTFQSVIHVIVSNCFPNYVFSSVWPDWMKDSNGSKREIDIFNESLKLGIEVDGPHHDEPDVHEIDKEKTDNFKKAMNTDLIRFHHSEFFPTCFGDKHLEDEYINKVYDHLLKNLPITAISQVKSIDYVFKSIDDLGGLKVVFKKNPVIEEVVRIIEEKEWTCLDIKFGRDIENRRLKKNSLYYFVSTNTNPKGSWQLGHKIKSGEYKGEKTKLWDGMDDEEIIDDINKVANSCKSKDDFESFCDRKYYNKAAKLKIRTEYNNQITLLRSIILRKRWQSSNFRY